MKISKMVLNDFAGQGCDVEPVLRDNGSSLVRFLSTPGYGNPSIEKEDLVTILKYISKLEAIDENINGNAGV